MEEMSILDTVFKTCACCGKNFTLRNYRMIPRAEFGDGLISIADKFSKVCKCCEKHPEMQLKSNRLALLKSKMAQFKANEHARLEKEKKRELEIELREMGINRYCTLNE